MSGIEGKQDLRHAAEELQRYLSDEIPPMMVVEYVEELLREPPEVTAKLITVWVQSQHRRSAAENVTAADLIFHALKKLSLLPELGLAKHSSTMRAIHEISRSLLQVCPAAERDELKIRLSRLGERETVLAARAEFLHREAGSAGSARTAAPPPGANAPEPKPDVETMGRGARVLSLLLGRLAKLRDPKAPREKESSEPAMLAQVLSTAALESKTNEDLARHLEKVKKEGVATPMAQVFRALGWSLPGWGPIGGDKKSGPAPTGRQLKAMDRIVALGPDPRERAKRWGEMIYAAIEQLNEGRLAQAVSILEVAKQLIAEKRADTDIVDRVLAQAEAAISEDRLRRLADVPAKHGLLRKVLEFFPSFRPEPLLTRLDGEFRRERRKLFLMLLECHGAGCRDAVITRLAAGMRGEFPDPEGFYRRNLAFLLRRIPRTGNERMDVEVELLAAMIAPGEPMMSAKEAVGALGELRDARAETVLVDRLRRLEADTIARGGDAERWEMADRLCAALARHATSRAIRAVVGHAYNPSPALGDALGRFSELSRVDLTVDPEQLAVLVQAIRDLSPSKSLGFRGKRGHHELSCHIQALAGTPSTEVRATLESIADKFKGDAVGDHAQRVLATLVPTAKKTNDALNGDLELFGLPNLLQTLAGSESSGELVLFDAKQTRQGSISMTRGKIARCEAGRLSGAEVVYLFMERPFPGTFVFRSSTGDGASPAGPPLDPMSLIMEGARRHDEYQQAKALVPDAVRFEAAGVPARVPDDEKDGDLVRDVWSRAEAGMPANDCELEMKADPFRVRRLYAFWIETAALRPRV